MENSMEIPQKIKQETTHDPAIPLLDLYTKKPKTLIRKSMCTPMVTAVLFTIPKIWR